MKAWRGGLGLAALAAGLGLLALGLAASPPDGDGVATEGQRPAAAPALPLPAAVPVPAARPAPAPARAAAAQPPGAELDRLVAAARRGDARASHAAYQALSACAAEAAACPGLPASLVQERLRFLAEAVRAGLPAAQIDFYMEGPDRLQALDEQALQAWREQALAGLRAASAQCEPFATGLLATLYDSGELAPRDAVRALAYAVAEGALRHHPPGDAALRSRLAEPVDDATLAAARVQGLSLAAACRADDSRS